MHDPSDVCLFASEVGLSSLHRTNSSMFVSCLVVTGSCGEIPQAKFLQCAPSTSGVRATSITARQPAQVCQGGRTNIVFTSSVRNMGFIVTADMTLYKQVSLSVTLPIVSYVISAASVTSLHVLPTLLYVRLFFLGVITLARRLPLIPYS